MKWLVYICLLLLLTACSNNKTPSDLKAYESMPELLDVKEEAFEYETITKQKLQDYFDLIRLKETYPEFNEEISSQLQIVKNDSIYPSQKLTEISIKNIQQIGDLLVVSDTEKRLILSFDMVSNDRVKRDTLVAIIKTNIVYIDEKEVVATQVSFSQK